MALEDAFGPHPADIAESIFEQQMPDIVAGGMHPADMADRLWRKLQVDKAKPRPVKPPPDFSNKGTPVPDLSSYGTLVPETAQPAAAIAPAQPAAPAGQGGQPVEVERGLTSEEQPKTQLPFGADQQPAPGAPVRTAQVKPAEPPAGAIPDAVAGSATATPQNLDDPWGGYPSVIGKGLARGVFKGIGNTVRGVGMVPEGVRAGAADQQEYYRRTLPKSEGGEGESLSQAAEWVRKHPTPIGEVKNAVTEAGKRIEQDTEKSFPLTAEEKDSIAGRASEGVGAGALGVGTMLAGGAGARALGATTRGVKAAGMAAGGAQMGLAAAPPAYDEAIKKIDEQIADLRKDPATKDKADDLEKNKYRTALSAAGYNGLLGATIGMLPAHIALEASSGIIRNTLAKVAPKFAKQLEGRLAYTLEKAIEGGVAFTGLGELQDYISKWIAREVYDPKAKYEPEMKRMLASFIAGSIIGGVSGTFTYKPRDRVRPDDRPPPRDETHPEDEPPPPPPPPPGDETGPRPDERGPRPDEAGTDHGPFEFKPTGPRGTGRRADILRDTITNVYGMKPETVAEMSVADLAQTINMIDALSGANAKRDMRSALKGKSLDDLVRMYDAEIDTPRRASRAQEEATKSDLDRRKAAAAWYQQNFGMNIPPDALTPEQVQRAHDAMKAGGEKPGGAEAPGQSQAESGPSGGPSGGSAKEQPTRAQEDASLRKAGWSDEDIKGFSPKEREREVKMADLLQQDDETILRKYGVGDDEIAGMSTAQRDAKIQELTRTGLPPDEPKPGTREAPTEDAAAAAASADKDHTHAQGEANNAQRGHMKWKGLDITIEAEKGSERRGIAPDGTPFATTVGSHYGYIRGLPPGADGQHPDVHVGDNPDAPHAYVLDEIDPKTGEFRQTKSFVGFDNPQEAIKAFLDTSSKDADHIGGLKVMPADEFPDFARSGALSKPVSDAMKKTQAEAKAKAEGDVHVDLGHLDLDRSKPLGGQAEKYVLAKGKETGLEHIVAIGADGEVVAHGHGTNADTGLGSRLRAAMNDPKAALAIHHNHPKSTSLGSADVSWLAMPGIHAIWAHGHNGTTSRAELTPGARSALGSDPTAARKKLADLRMRVEEGLYKKIRAAIADGKITRDEAKQSHGHLANMVLRDAGIIDYHTNFDAAPVVEKLGLQPHIDAEAKSAARSIYGRETEPHARRAVDVRHPGDLGASLEIGRGHAGGIGAERRDDRARQEDAGAESEGIGPHHEAHAEVEEAIKADGVDPDHVAPAHLAAAADLYANLKNAGMRPDEAFVAAAIRSLVHSGHMSEDTVRGVMGDEAAEKLLHPERSPEYGLPAPTSGAATGRPTAAAETGKPESSAEGGAQVREGAQGAAEGGREAAAVPAAEVRKPASAETGRPAGRPAAGGERPTSAGDRVAAGEGPEGRAEHRPSRAAQDAQVERDAEIAGDRDDLQDRLHEALKTAKIPIDTVLPEVGNRAIALMAEREMHPLDALEKALAQVERRWNDVPEQLALELGAPKEALDAVVEPGAPEAGAGAAPEGGRPAEGPKGRGAAASEEREPAPGAGKRAGEGPKPRTEAAPGGERPAEGGVATRAGFLARYRSLIRAKYQWAQDPDKLAKFMKSVEDTLGGGVTTWTPTGEALSQAWKAAGGKGKPTLKALRALPTKEVTTEKQGPAEASGADWWDGELTAFGRGQLLKAIGATLSDKVKWDHVPERVRLELLDLKGGEHDLSRDAAQNAPTWAEVLAVLPKDKDGNKDFTLLASVMKDVAGKHSYKDLTPEQQIETMRRLKGEPEKPATDIEAQADAALDDIFGPETKAAPAPKREKAPASTEDEDHETFVKFVAEEQRRAKAKRQRAGAPETAAAAPKKPARKSVQALDEFFGGKKKPGGLAEEPPPYEFDEDTYEKVKPLFLDAASEFAGEWKDVGDLARKLVAEMLDSGSEMETLRKMRPYLKRFVVDVASGKIDIAKAGAPAENQALNPEQVKRLPVAEQVTREQAAEAYAGAERDLIRLRNEIARMRPGNKDPASHISRRILEGYRAKAKTAQDTMERMRELMRDLPPSESPAPAPKPEVQKPPKTITDDMLDIPPELRRQKGWRDIGKNSRGETVYEDDRGVRSYVTDKGIRVTEPVGMRPTKQGMEIEINPSSRGDEWKPASEVPNGGQTADQAKPGEHPVQPERVYTDIGKAIADLKAGKLEQLPERAGFCYKCAADWVISNGETYVIGTIGDGQGRRIYHGLVEYDRGGKTFLYDPTLEAAFDEPTYQKIADGGWVPVHRMARNEVMPFGVRTGKYPDPATLKLPPVATIQKGKETGHEQPGVSEPHPEPLADIPAGEGGGPQEARPPRGGDAGGGEARPGGAGGSPEEPGLSGTRGPRGRAKKPRVSRPRAGSRPAGVGEEGTGGPREGTPGGAAGVSPEEAPTTPAINFRITDELRLGKGSEGQKFSDNIAAIKTLKAIEREHRRASPDEQHTLARYVGWGGLANAFRMPESKEFKPDWADRGAELEGLVTPDELRAARRSTRNAHYTSETVVRAMWDIARRLGFRGGIATELSAGTGNFLGLVPESIAGRTKFIAIEYDSITARIAKALYPQETVLHAPLQEVPLPDGEAMLNIGNPPFGSESLHFPYKLEYNRFSIHNQFFLAGLDALAPNGLHIAVVSRYLLDSQDDAARKQMAIRGDLLGAIRLPDTAFKENARTEVVTDIVIMRRRTPGEQMLMDEAFSVLDDRKAKDDAKARARSHLRMEAPWLDVEGVKDPLGGEPMPVNWYFARKPEMIMGRLERSGTMRERGEVNVRLDDASRLGEMLRDAAGRVAELAKTRNAIQDIDRDVINASLDRHKAMSEALEIAISGAEAGHIEAKDGNLDQVYERETPSGGYELARRPLTPETPWSRQIYQSHDGRYYTLEPQGLADQLRAEKAAFQATPPAGRPPEALAAILDQFDRSIAAAEKSGAKAKAKDEEGNLTKRNVYERKYYPDNKVPGSLRLGEAKLARLKDLVALRDLTKRQIVLETQDAPEAEMEGNRVKLAAAYKDFVGKNGFLNEPRNVSLISDMPDGALIQALETSYRAPISEAKAARTGVKPKAAEATPAAIMSRRVVPKYEPATKADSPADAISISLSERGSIDIPRIAGLLGMDEKAAVAALTDGDRPLAFFDPETQTYETRNNYLTGLVAQKLKAAEAAGLSQNVRALKAVQPEPWGAHEINVIMGSSWVPPNHYADFAKHLVGGDAQVFYSEPTNSFGLQTGNVDPGKVVRWRTDGMRFEPIFEGILNSRVPKVFAYDNDGNKYLDKDASAIVALRAREIENEFSDWVFSDPDRRASLVDKFNKKFNTRIARQHDGSHLKLVGKVPDEVIAMRRHQLNGVWRGIYERFVLYDHVVGSGKTFTAIARIMERRRMGLSRKPVAVVPNHLVEQWAADVYRLYPGAKVLAAGRNSFSRENRRRLFAKIATGDWDIVILPHSSFGFIGISPETERRFLDEQLRVAMEAVEEARDEASAQGLDGGFRTPFNVKEAERLVETIQKRIDKLKTAKKDRLLTFEQMGIDDLTVDEAHEFKNLFYSSRMTGVRGMGDRGGSQKAFDLYNKVKVLTESPRGSVAFLTGTPISNSAVEMFTMLRYLASRQLRDLGLEHFDAWRAQSVSATSAYEPTESGNLKEVTRLGRNWSNMRALMELWYSVTDAVSQEDVNTWHKEDNEGRPFPVPPVKHGGRKEVVVKPTSAQQAELTRIIHGFDHLDGITDPKERNAERLRLMDQARKVSLDVRAVNPRHPSKEEGGKLDHIADNVARIYKAWDKDAGTQLVFLDRSVKAAKGDAAVLKEYDKLVARRDEALAAGDEEGYRRAIDDLDKYDPNEIQELRSAQQGGWNAYDQLKANLIARGIPAEEIRFVQEANSDAEKKALFDSVNDGKVRVLIGSTPRMGAGTNVQERIVALHHGDVTWKPSDIEQREGRIIRQGNSLLDKYGRVGHNGGPPFEVEILAYVTERTIDAKMWDLNSTKLKMINGIRKYGGEFSMDFEDEDAVGMAEIAALASGDPLLMERVKLTAEIDKLEMLERGHRRRVYGLQDQIAKNERTINELPAKIARWTERARALNEGLGAVKKATFARTVTVNGKTYKGIFEAMKAADEVREDQQRGVATAPYQVEVDGKKYTNKVGYEDAIGEAIGDNSPFEAEVAGETLTKRSQMARAIADHIKEGADVAIGDGYQAKVGTAFGGLDVYLDIDHPRGGSWDVTLTVKSDGDIVGQHYFTQAEKPKGTHQGARALLDGAEKQVEGYANYSPAMDLNDVERAKKETPGLEQEVARPFKQADELAQNRRRLEEVIGILSARDKAAREGTPVESEAPEEGGFAEDEPNYAPPFYSAVLRAVEGGPNSARPDQWTGYLKNKPGVKPEEMAWLGLDAWLGSQKGPVTRQAVADYVRANQIEVKTAEKGKQTGGGTTALPTDQDAWDQREPAVSDASNTHRTMMTVPGLPEGAWIEAVHDAETGDLRGWSVYRDHEEIMEYGPNEPFEIVAQALGHAIGGDLTMDETRWSNYTLPGGENYREVLLTLPGKGLGTPIPERHPSGEGFALRYANGDYVLQPAGARNPGEPTQWETRESAVMYGQPVHADSNLFRSSHWSEPNVVAHVRMDDRVIDGKKTLHVAEIQSDWHQQGRKRGYREAIPPEERATLEAEDREIIKRVLDMQNAGEAYLDRQARRFNPDFLALQERRAEIERRLHQFDRVPDAPFKTTWPELALKRVLRYAADEGYDQISWDTGETNADRYDLSEHIREVRARKDAPGHWRLEVFYHDKGNTPLIVVDRTERLPDHVGKDLADKIVADGGGAYSGLDLKVGGEGMVGFYDRMLPAAANKLGKRFGAQVGRSDMPFRDDRNIDIPFIVRDRSGNIVDENIFDENSASELARDHGGTYELDPRLGIAKTAPIHTLPITPALRSAATGEGFPLFKKTSGVPGDSDIYAPKAELTEQQRARRFEVEKALKAAVEHMAGRTVSIRFPDEIEGETSAADYGESGARLAGAYLPARQLIEIAMGDRTVYDPLSTTIHETLHHLVELFATPAERGVFNTAVPRHREEIRQTLRDKFNFTDKDVNDLSPREVNAIAGEIYLSAKARGEPPPAGVHVGLRALLERILQFFRRLGNWLRMRGWKTAEDLWNDIYGGKWREQMERGGRPMSEQGKRWAAGEVVLGARGPRRRSAAGGGGTSGPAPSRPFVESRLARNLHDFWTSTFQPELFSDAALQADPLFAKMKSASAQEKDALLHRLQKHWDYWNKQPLHEQLHFLSALEGESSFRDPQQQRMADLYRSLLDKNWAEEQRWGSKAAYVEDYISHIWERPDEWRKFAESKRTSQVGPTWFQKKRTYDYISEGLAAGLKLKFTNPIDIITHRLISGVDMRQRMKLLYDLKEMGLSREVRATPPSLQSRLTRQGWDTLNAPDRRQWLIAPDVRYLWKNAVEAKGLWQAEGMGGGLFRGWMALKNVYVPIKLALSAFHPIHVYFIHAAEGSARMFNVLRKEHDLPRAFKALLDGWLGPLQAAIPGVAHSGKTARKAWLAMPENRTARQNAVVALMNEGGISAQLSEQLRIAAKRSLAKAWQEKNAFKMMPAGVRRAIELMQAAVFEHWIPNIKVAAYLHQAADLLRRNPHLMSDDIQRSAALRQIGKDIDNGFGEMFYGSLFWNRTVKDASIASFLSLSWNLGFSRKYLAAPFKALAHVGGEAGLLMSRSGNPTIAAAGKAIAPAQTRQTMREASQATSSVVAYVIIGALMGALISKMFTGEDPKGLDTVFPRAGGHNPDGTPRRMTTSFFHREYFMWKKHVEARGGNAVLGSADMLWNKLMFQPFVELLKNEDYYGRELWSEGAPLFDQVKQYLGHLWREQTDPMSMQGARRARETGGTARDEVMSYLGFPPAPSYVEKTATQNLITHYFHEYNPSKVPYEEALKLPEQIKARRAILRAKEEDNDTALDAAKEAARKSGLTEKQINNIGKVESDISMFRRLRPSVQKIVLDKAPDGEFLRYYEKANGRLRGIGTNARDLDPEEKQTADALEARAERIRKGTKEQAVPLPPEIGARPPGTRPKYTPGVFGTDNQQKYVPPATPPPKGAQPSTWNLFSPP